MDFRREDLYQRRAQSDAGEAKRIPAARAFDDDDFEIDKGLVLEPCHGHSPGHVVLNVDSGGAKGVFIGDVIHHPMQILFPHLSCRADFDMDASRKVHVRA